MTELSKLATGDQILDYRIREKVGEGGFGQVFLAQHEVLDRTVAIKVPKTSHSLSALRTEGVIQAKLQHPNIVKTLEISISHDPPYVVMEYVDGANLREVLKNGSIPWKRALKIVRDIAAGLAHAHDSGYIHGDVKPSNVLIPADKNAPCKITDFGLGREYEAAAQSLQISRSLTLAEADAELAGTLKYLAPEVKRGETPDEQSDIYSLGLLMFEMLTGSIPEGCETPGDICQGLPTELDNVFSKCYVRKAKRFKSMNDVVRSLDQVLKPQSTPKTEAGSPAQATDEVVEAIFLGDLSERTTSSKASKLSQILGLSKRKAEPQVVELEAGERFSFAAVTATDDCSEDRCEASESVSGKSESQVQSYEWDEALDDDDEPAKLPVRAWADGLMTEAKQTDRVCGSCSWDEFHSDSIHDLADFPELIDQLTLSMNAQFPEDEQFQAVDSHGFDLAFGVADDNEPQHRIFALCIPHLNVDNAKTFTKFAGEVFELEKGLWEKEVTFVLVTSSIHDKAQVDWIMKTFATGWWRRRRVVVFNSSNHQVTAKQYGCELADNPLKERFIKQLQTTTSLIQEDFAESRQLARFRQQQSSRIGTLLTVFSTFCVIAVGLTSHSVRPKKDSAKPVNIVTTPSVPVLERPAERPEMHSKDLKPGAKISQELNAALRDWQSRKVIQEKQRDYNAQDQQKSAPRKVRKLRQRGPYRDF